jgi:hypothetical protein
VNYEIKPLRWEERDGYWRGFGFLGTYNAREDSGVAIEDGYEVFNAVSVDDAKRHCENHHQAKLLPALIGVTNA